MEHIADLFGNYRTIKPGGKVLDERRELVKFFCKTFDYKRPDLMGMRLAHYKTISDLYAIKSGVNDRLKRDGLVRARKWFFWVTDTKPI